LSAGFPRASARFTRGEFAGAARRHAHSDRGLARFRIDAGPEKSAELWNALVSAGARRGGIVARDTCASKPAARAGADIDENVYRRKRGSRKRSAREGCYIGQEVVAKIDTYGGSTSGSSR
jgi:hypothetical protein